MVFSFGRHFKADPGATTTGPTEAPTGGPTAGPTSGSTPNHQVQWRYDDVKTELDCDFDSDNEYDGDGDDDKEGNMNNHWDGGNDGDSGDHNSNVGDNDDGENKRTNDSYPLASALGAPWTAASLSARRKMLTSTRSGKDTSASWHHVTMSSCHYVTV